MRGQGSIDSEIARLAGRQRGVVARAQLIAAGIKPRAIDYWLTAGRLHLIHRGVYLVGHAVPPQLARETAALLALGPRAALSDRTATALWELLAYPANADVCLTVPQRSRLERPGLAIARRALERRDVRTRYGLRVTSPPRTILDNAAALDLDALERLIAEAGYRGLASEAELREQLERNPGRPGVCAVRAVLDLPGGPSRTRSAPERELLRLLRDAGIDGFETNAHVHGYEVDVLWRAERLVVEIDGYAAHRGRAAFERDRLKAAKLEARGLVVMPVTPRQIRDDPGGVLGRLRRALAIAARGGRAGDAP